MPEMNSEPFKTLYSPPMLMETVVLRKCVRSMPSYDHIGCIDLGLSWREDNIASLRAFVPQKQSLTVVLKGDVTPISWR